MPFCFTSVCSGVPVLTWLLVFPRVPFAVSALFIGVSAVFGGRTCHVPPGASGEHLFTALSIHR